LFVVVFHYLKKNHLFSGTCTCFCILVVSCCVFDLFELVCVWSCSFVIASLHFVYLCFHLHIKKNSFHCISFHLCIALVFKKKYTHFICIVLYTSLHHFCFTFHCSCSQLLLFSVYISLHHLKKIHFISVYTLHLLHSVSIPISSLKTAPVSIHFCLSQNSPHHTFSPPLYLPTLTFPNNNLITAQCPETLGHIQPLLHTHFYKSAYKHKQTTHLTNSIQPLPSLIQNHFKPNPDIYISIHPLCIPISCTLTPANLLPNFCYIQPACHHQQLSFSSNLPVPSANTNSQYSSHHPKHIPCSISQYLNQPSPPLKTPKPSTATILLSTLPFQSCLHLTHLPHTPTILPTSYLSL